MVDALTSLLWCGGGWFLFAFVVALGGSKSAAWVLVRTVFCWFLLLDVAAVVFSSIGPLVRHVGFGWRFAVSFVALPYLPSFFRAWWLRRRCPVLP